MTDAVRNMPNEGALMRELRRIKYLNTFFETLRSTIFSLIVVAAVAVIVATLVLPVLQITGTSMTETLNDGDVV